MLTPWLPRNVKKWGNFEEGSNNYDMRLTVRCWNNHALMIFVADLGKMPLFFCLLAAFSSSSSSVPSPDPMLFSKPPSKPPSVWNENKQPFCRTWSIKEYIQYHGLLPSAIMKTFLKCLNLEGNQYFCAPTHGVTFHQGAVHSFVQRVTSGLRATFASERLSSIDTYVTSSRGYGFMICRRQIVTLQKKHQINLRHH